MLNKDRGYFFRRFLSLGSTPGMNEWQTRRLWLLNAFYLVAHITFIAGIVQTYLVDGVKEGNLLLLLAFIFELGFVALFLKQIRLSEIWFGLCGNGVLFLLNNIYGEEAGVYLYYFPFILIIAFLVDLNKLWDTIVLVGLTLTLITIGLFMDHHLFYVHYAHEQIASSFRFSLFISALSTALIALVIVRMGYVQHLNFIDRMSERNVAEQSMKNSLKEKETLLAEVHHRVKNNLAVISSLLNLQMNSVTDEYTRSVLRESRNRVGSMALIHRKLYQNKNVEEIDFANYAASLVDEIALSYEGAGSKNVMVKIDAEHMNLPLTIAVPCGLILNEIVSNSFKHAFPQGRKGNIHIRFLHLNQQKNTVEMLIDDDGIGISDAVDIDKATSLGLTIISSLADQLDAQWSLAKKGASETSFRMSFHLPSVTT